MAAGRDTPSFTEARNTLYIVDFIPKVGLEIAVDDELVVNTVKPIENTAKTGGIEDGKIFILQLEDAVRAIPIPNQG